MRGNARARSGALPQPVRLQHLGGSVLALELVRQLYVQVAVVLLVGAAADKALQQRTDRYGDGYADDQG